jgi:hypothetical protein
MAAVPGSTCDLLDLRAPGNQFDCGSVQPKSPNCLIHRFASQRAIDAVEMIG